MLLTPRLAYVASASFLGTGLFLPSGASPRQRLP